MLLDINKVDSVAILERWLRDYDSLLNLQFLYDNPSKTTPVKAPISNSSVTSKASIVSKTPVPHIQW